MKMLARSPGQTFHLAHGAHYRADAERIVYVETADVAEMRRVGCIEAPADEPAAPAPAAPETAAEPDSLAEFAASLPEGPSKRFAEHPEQ